MLLPVFTQVFMAYSKVNAFFKLLTANVLVFLAILIVVEIGGQTYAYFHPSYKVLPFIPHPILGWSFIPNSEHIMTGNHWYAREFAAKVKINSHGFRDIERTIEKDENTIRIALIGDSIIAGRQLEFEKTPGQLLEKKLNKIVGPKTGKKYEVLNFGVPGYGTDQIFLNWENYVSKFSPDYVFLYIFERNYLRTISSEWCQRGFLGADNLGDGKCLNVRPLPSIDSSPPIILNQKNWSTIDTLETSGRFKDVLVFLEKLPLQINLPSDYEAFTLQQKEFIKKEMNGKRMIKAERKFFLLDIFSIIKRKITSNNSESEENKLRWLRYSGKTEDFPTWNKTNIVNIKLLQRLGNLIKKNGHFVIIDSFQFHSSINPATQFSTNWLRTLSNYYQFGYIPLYKKLNESMNQGDSPRWKYDSHLNEIGSQMFTDSMLDYLDKKIN